MHFRTDPYLVLDRPTHRWWVMAQLLDRKRDIDREANP